MSDLAALIERVDLPALVERYSGPGRRSGATFSFCCPNPEHPDRSPSFTVSKNRRGRQVARCWSQCDWHGDALAFVQWVENCGVREAADKLRGFLGESRPFEPTHRPKLAPVAKQPSAPPQDNATAPPADTAERLLSAYLSKRGWPREAAGRYGLRVVIGRGGRPYVRHPFYRLGETGELITQTWQDRLCHDLEGVSKWDTPARSSLLIYNEPALSREGLELVVICEGPADAISAEVALAAYPNAAAVAVAGSGAWKHEYTDRYARLFAEKSVLVVGDRDAAGASMRTSVGQALGRIAKRVRVVTPPVNDLTDWCQRDGFAEVGRLLVKYATAPATGPQDSPPTPPPPKRRDTLTVAESVTARDYQQLFEWLTDAGLNPRWVELSNVAVAA